MKTYVWIGTFFLLFTVALSGAVVLPQNSQESTHVVISPTAGLPGQEISFPIYLEAATGVEVGSIALDLVFPNQLISFVTVQGSLAAIIHKFGVSVDFLREFRAESVFRCDYKASKLVEPNRDEARAPSGNSSARRGLYICVGAGSQGTVRWDTDGASVMRRAFVRDKTMPGAPRCDEKFPEPGHRF